MSQFKLTYVIEDNPITAAITKILLEKTQRAGRVELYANGQRALKQLTAELAAGEKVPDLILLDLNMPLMDGWEFLDELSLLPLTQPICVLVLTSSINPEDRAKAARYATVGGYFAKPLDVGGVMQMLHLRRAASGPLPLGPSAAPDAALHHLVYQSRATAPLTEAELARLLAQSRAHNAANGLTGILYYSRGNIVQLLEGSKAHVHAVFGRIARDPRHTSIVTLADGPTSQRLFDQWSMGFRAVNSAGLGQLLGYINPDEQAYPPGEPAQADSDLHMLLTALVTEDGPVY